MLLELTEKNIDFPISISFAAIWPIMEPLANFGTVNTVDIASPYSFSFFCQGKISFPGEEDCYSFSFTKGQSEV